MRSELELHYQPVWRLEVPRRITGVEALLRWRHPDRGLLAPESFIGLAEQGPAGDALTDWVLGEACRQAREWQHAGLLPRVGMNVSRAAAPGAGLRKTLRRQVRSHGLQGHDFFFSS